MVGQFFGRQNCSSLVEPYNLCHLIIGLKCSLGAFSLTNLTYLGDGQALQPIIEYLKSDEYVSCDYGDCLRPQYSIPGIIECLLEGNNITTSGVL